MVKQGGLFMNFGLNVKKTRTNAKMTQVQLAEKAGITASMISQIEKGIRNASIVSAFEISKALNVSLDELCKGA
jgi:transcriptional regulator with XRE-family HTH domain